MGFQGPRPRWESLQCFLDPLTKFKGPTSKGRVKERKEKGGEREEKKERKKKGGRKEKEKG